MLLCGCSALNKGTTSASNPAAAIAQPSPYELAVVQSRETHLPLVMLIIEKGRGEPDRRAHSAFEATDFSQSAVIAEVMDLNISRDRALLLPFHATDTPTLVCLSPAGVIASRDEGVVTSEIIKQRVLDLMRVAPSLDAKLAALQHAAVSNDPNNQMALADFLLAAKNDREALPPLTAVSDNESADLALRVRAWVALGKAHLWIGEPEKARYSAIKLSETLGPRTGDAISGCNLVRGIQDTTAKRYDRARDEFQKAISASPASVYAKEAVEHLAQLPIGKST